jgi:DNA polymerase I-like protein with 3'-5' exonuclease and polymerase domains
MATALQTASAAASAAGSSTPAAVNVQLQLQPQVWHAAAEVWATLLLHEAFSAALQRLGDGGQLQRLLDSIEVPLQRVLSAMEANGVRCDKQVLLEQRDQLQVRQERG